jgi:hypothetical protein
MNRWASTRSLFGWKGLTRSSGGFFRVLPHNETTTSRASPGLKGLAEAPISSRHVPVDAGHGNCLGAHHDVVDNVIDGVRTRRADVLMH